MITKRNVVSISQMRKNADSVLEKVDTLNQPIYLFSRSQIKAVLLSPEKYAELQELTENFLDQQELLAVSAEELKKAETWEKAKAQV
jgi:PHD/YefM family antitoxin component YafN of YafNO toxin-antitoxin module